MSWRGGCLLCDYASWNCRGGERVVEENDAFLTVVPFWAVWPFETMVICETPSDRDRRLTDAERDGLADILQRTTARYDRVFQRVVPVLHGISPAAHRWRGARGVSLPRCTFIRRCCARRRCGSFWSATRCSPRRSGTSRRRRRRSALRQVTRRAGVLGLDVLEEDALELPGLQSRRDFEFESMLDIRRRARTSA